MIKLNLGCGMQHLDGWINVDKWGPCDECVDLEQVPWPWGTSSAEQVRLDYSLPCLGQTFDAWCEIIRELYRVCASEAQVCVVVYHPQHDYHLNDPSYVRPITPAMLATLSQATTAGMDRREVQPPLGFRLGVDMRLESVKVVPAGPWKRQDEAELHQAATAVNNVILEYRMTMRVKK